MEYYHTLVQAIMSFQAFFLMCLCEAQLNKKTSDCLRVLFRGLIANTFCQAN